MFPVNSIDEIKSKLEELRSDHPKSRHVCYAYRLGSKNIEERSSDDGEPSGSAGLPILNQLYSNDLSNVLLAVVRYFGGTKLGASGLIRAYKEASIDALSKVNPVELIEYGHVMCEFSYDQLGIIQNRIERESWKLIHSEYGLPCRFTIGIPVDQYEEAVVSLKSIYGLIIED